MATSLDDIADYIWGAAKRIVNYQIDDQYNTLPQFAEIISKSIAAINTAVYGLRGLKNLRDITASCVIVNSLENAADDFIGFNHAKTFLLQHQCGCAD